jgi:hypothetical protein
MLRWGTGLLVAWTILTAATPAKAQWFETFCEKVKRDYHRNQCWPEPFLQADRAATIAPFGVMVANGWRRQNLISDYHFDEEKHQLSLAGETKLRFILTQMPPSRRTIFVQQGLTQEETALRMNAVNNAAVKILPPGVMPNVVESDLPNDGWPADDVDAVARRFNATRPDPRLQAVQSNGDSGGGGSNNSN